MKQKQSHKQLSELTEEMDISKRPCAYSNFVSRETYVHHESSQESLAAGSILSANPQPNFKIKISQVR